MRRSGRERDEALRNREYETLSDQQRRGVDRVIDDAKRQGGTARYVDGQTEYYAYKHPGGGMAWGINIGPTGENSRRGVKP